MKEEDSEAHEKLLKDLERLVDEAADSGMTRAEILGAIDDAEAFLIQKAN